MSSPIPVEPQLLDVVSDASNELSDVVALMEAWMLTPSFGEHGEPQGRLLHCALEKIKEIHTAFDNYI